MRYVLLILVALLSVACGQDPVSGDGLPVDRGGDGPMVTRSQIILRADEFARVHWTMLETNRTGAACDGFFASPYPEGNRIGMGYKWGGWDDVATFLECIGAGYGTGAGPDAYQDVSPDCITGTSCTGLVSRAWHLDHKYTLNYSDPNIERKFQEISDEIAGVDLAAGQVDALKKGDALISDTHVILFVYQTRDGRPMIIDSSGPGVRFRALSWPYLAGQRYRAIRYRNVIETGDPPGTVANPIAIDSRDLPLVERGNTRDVVSMAFDRYAIAPQISQTGPEVVYRFRMRAAGTVEIHCTDLAHEGIDNDLHLLGSAGRSESLTALDCIARGDHTIHHELEAGSYLVVVDSGADTPGEYTLTIELE
jgi:hypothetical protein